MDTLDAVLISGDELVCDRHRLYFLPSQQEYARVMVAKMMLHVPAVIEIVTCPEPGATLTPFLPACCVVMGHQPMGRLAAWMTSMN